MASKLQWGSESTFQKLSLASFLHDITLENQALAEIQTLAELDPRMSEFTEKEIKAFREHPTVAADMAKRMSEIPPDVDTIIRQHHERPDASGFPRKLGHSYIAPLSCVFIVAHDLSQFVLKEGDNFEIAKFIKEVSHKYKSSQFKKVLASIETLSNPKGLGLKN
jgi:response regulator RpfG family c-di-GMP phosphodiesterase